MSDPRIRIELLGGLRVTAPGAEPIDFSHRQTGALLAYLALRPAEPTTREQIAGALWPDEDMEVCRQRLRQSLYRLRRDLSSIGGGAEQVLVSARDTICLTSDRVDTDIAQFQSELGAYEAVVNPQESAERLSRAVALYRGDLVPGFYQECFVEKRRRLAEQHRQAVLALPLAYEAAGDLPRAIGAANAAIALDPLMEEAHCALMRLYAGAGQPAAVLRQYQELCRVLREELDEEPSPETCKLMESLREAGRTALASRSLIPTNGNGSPPDEATAPAESQTIARNPVRRRLSRRALAPVMLAVLAWIVFRIMRPPTRPSTAIPFIPIDLPDHRVLWTTTVPLVPGDNWSEPSGIALDPQDNIYVVGFVNTSTKSDTDYLTQKLSPIGGLLWQRRYNGTGSDVDRARGIMVDLDGNVVVTGDSDNGKGSDATRLSGLDIATLKYDAAGNRKYAIRWNGASDGEDRPVKLIMDPRNGDAIVAGSSWTPAANHGKGGYEMVCLRVDRRARDGSRPTFARSYLGTGHMETRVTDAVTGLDGATWLVGTASTGTKTGPDVESVALRIDANGEIVWANTVGGRFVGDRGPVISADSIASCAMRPSPHGLTTDMLMTRMLSGGSQLWSIPFSADGLTDNTPTAICAGYGGAVYAAGQYSAPGGAAHLTIAAYDHFGNRNWARRLLGTNVGPDIATAVKWRSDALYIAGVSCVVTGTGEPEYRLLALKLRAHNGEPIWMSRSIRLNVATGDPPSAETIRMALGSDGCMVVTCKVAVSGKDAIEVVKFSP